MNDLWIKAYDDPDTCRTTAANYRWLADLGAAAPRPALRTVRTRSLEFEQIQGDHATQGDLTMLAGLLGRMHQVAYDTDLHRARLDRHHETGSGHCIPDFIESRREVIRTRLAQGCVPNPVFDAGQAHRLLDSAAARPAAFYKDTNPRNVLISAGGPVLVDFDDLTLAPFGYDLAKLIVTLAMTHGPISATKTTQALTAYNGSIAKGRTNLPPVSSEELMAWAEIHHILTSPYLGRGGYRYGWHQLRHAAAPGDRDGYPIALG